MSEPVLKIIDIFFFVFHTSFILFNIFGWIVPKWRFANFITLSITAFSWFILGIWYGWGYCFCADWHFWVRDQLNYQNMDSSYIHFLILKFTSLDIAPNRVEIFTVIIFFTAYIISTYLNIKKWLRN